MKALVAGGAGFVGPDRLDDVTERCLLAGLRRP